MRSDKYKFRFFAVWFVYLVYGLSATYLIHDFGYIVGFIAGIISASILYVTRRD